MAEPSVPPMMQLYLNYKLKSVAHLPWRQMTYKFLNTIVDDLGCAAGITPVDCLTA